MAAFKFELVSPERLLMSGEADQAVVPGSEGYFTMLAEHAPFLSTLRPGILEVSISGDPAVKRFFVRGGFADASPAGLTVLAEEAIPVEEIDAAVLDLSVRNAEEDVADARTDDERRQANERLSQLREVVEVLRAEGRA